jgi:hypothetical protein
MSDSFVCTTRRLLESGFGFVGRSCHCFWCLRMETAFDVWPWENSRSRASFEDSPIQHDLALSFDRESRFTSLPFTPSLLRHPFLLQLEHPYLTLSQKSENSHKPWIMLQLRQPHWFCVDSQLDAVKQENHLFVLAIFFSHHGLRSDFVGPRAATRKIKICPTDWTVYGCQITNANKKILVLSWFTLSIF